MDLRTISLRALVASLLLGGTAMLATPNAALAQTVLRYGVDQATIAWPEPSAPEIQAYVVYESRNGEPEQVAVVVDEPRATIYGAPGDRVVARVRAIGRSTSTSPVVASTYSPPSPEIIFLPAAVWNAPGFLALQCAVCAELELRPLSNAAPGTRTPGLPEPWRLVDIGRIAPNSYDELWQNEDTGALILIPLGAGVAKTIAGSVGSDLTHFEAFGLAELDGDPTREILVRDVESGALLFWEYQSGRLVPIGGANVSTYWRLVGVADFDGDGLSDIWWQAQEPGRLEVWRTNGTSPTGVMLRVDTSVWRADIVAVADFDGDGQPEPLWRTTDDEFVVSYLRAGSQGSLGSLVRNAVLPGLPDDDQLEIKGTAPLTGQAGDQILVQNRVTYGVSAIFPAIEYAPARAPLFDVTEPFELVYTP